ncbi:MAG TPA: MFS transporter [Steroidobacteraceae bacterium]|nr:MFS transporter [Steroidobacteraceae bacterium]
MTPDASTRAGPRQAFLGPAGRDRLLFTTLYFAEGVPIGFLWWALPAVLREQSVQVDRITTLTAALAVPWTLKFLAGPAIDRSVARGARLRSWILGCQLAMGFALLPLAAHESLPGFALLLGLLFIHACFAAVQDVAIDALCIRTVPADRLGNINGWMQFGMTAGRAVAAASVPMIIYTVGWRLAIGLVVALVWLPMLVVALMAREPPRPQSRSSAEGGGLGQLLSRALVPAIGVALLAGAGFEAVGALSGPLLVDLRFEPALRSAFFGAIAPIGLATGGLLAAVLADRLGLRGAVALGVLGTAIAASALGYSVSADVLPEGRYTHLALFGAVYLGAGFLISASYACFMNIVKGHWAATRFSLLMALTNACESASALIAGRLVAPLGYGGALIALAGLSVFSLPFLRKLDATGDQAHVEK